MILVNSLILFKIIEISCANGLQLYPKALPDVGLSILELVPKYKYPIELHEVVTSDGYILGMHRISHRKNETVYTKRPVVFLMHGILASSMDFVNAGPKQGIGFLLADAGYDVWIGNQRGNTWSRQHIKFNPDKDDKFWDFSFHEIGVYDLAAKIDYIVAKTGQEKISCISHSQGSTSFFAFLSTRPEFNDKITILISLAPVAFMNHIRSKITIFLANIYPVVKAIITLFNINEVVPHLEIYTPIGSIFCNDKSLFQPLCVELLAVILGNEPLLNRTILPVIFSSDPAGGSIKQFQHYLLNVIGGKFRPYDYGYSENLARYGSPEPPNYELSKISAPIILIGCENDVLAGPEDVDTLEEHLPNVVKRERYLPKEFAHFDYFYSKNVEKLLLSNIINSIKQYNS